MHSAKRKHIISGTLAIAGLLLWLFYWLFIASADSGSLTTLVEENGHTREVVTYDPKLRYRPYIPLAVAGVYGALIGALVTYFTRKASDRALYVFLIAPITAAVSGTLIFLLSYAIPKPENISALQSPVEWLYILLAAALLYGAGIAIWTGIPAILGAFAASSFLKARDSETVSPPPLPHGM